MRIDDLASNTTRNLPVEGQWWKPVAGSEKLAIEACKLQSTEGGIPRSTSWIMSWCRQEVIRHRRALMNPTSVTRKGANDFRRWKLTDDMEDGGHEMNEGLMYVVGGTGWTLWISWTYNDTDWWTGSITPKWMVWAGPWCYRWMKTTQPDTDAERKCHVQEWLDTNKVSSSFFLIFPQSLLTSTSLFLSSLRRITYACSIIHPSGEPIA